MYAYGECVVNRPCSKTGEEAAAQRLQSLLQGISMTQRQLERVSIPSHALQPLARASSAAASSLSACPACAQAFESNGVTKVEPKVGDSLDPNLHEALFDMPVPNQEPGTIGVVTKVLASPLLLAKAPCCFSPHTPFLLWRF
jgi:hypothetical protein